MNKKELLEMLDNAIPDEPGFVNIEVEFYADAADRKTSLEYLAELNEGHFGGNVRIETEHVPSNGTLRFRFGVP
ncbi:hypothetical protein [Xanthomonas phage Suba]|uniref:Uncharacterized protein n=1 Tax=Xanthomonas phage Suba TaxID=2674975 RepID=A0A679KGL6_9CAUD|nr:hypothetical protein QAY88_gp41 [Xanthomonas phage Suba]CAA2409846.1 hypothetical protein [Xanthomonas phage Suba]